MTTTEEGLQVTLHPLPLLSISDHFTRQALHHSNLDVRIIGGLLGTQQGRQVEILNSFELALIDNNSSTTTTTTNEVLNLDHEYFTTRREQFRQVFPTFDFLGWYTCSTTKPSNLESQLHKQFLRYNESPLLLQFDPTVTSHHRSSTSTSTIEEEGGEKNGAATKDLPVTIFETVLEPSEKGEPEPTLVRVDYEIETGEAEKVAVDEVSKVGDEGGRGGTTGKTQGGNEPTNTNTASLIATLSTQRNALSMLSSRVTQITKYLESVSRGEAPKDEETLRQIQALVSGLKGQGGAGGDGAEKKEGGGGMNEGLEKEFMTEYNDALLTTYLSSLTKQMLTANELLDKQLILVQSSLNTSSTGGGGGTGIGAGSGRNVGSGGGGGRKGKVVMGGSTTRGGVDFGDWA